jgi:hypothetical protein
MTTRNPIADEHVVRLAAVGDLLLAAGPGNRAADDIERAFAEVRPILAGCDIVLGNLECCLPGDGPKTPSEPRVISTPRLVDALAETGLFHVLSLANNHMFDCLDAGFLRVRDALAGHGIANFGAGMDIDEACRATILERSGLRIGFLGAVAPSTGPSRLAAAGTSGAAPLAADAMDDAVRRLRASVDHVIVSPHWGDERFRLPSPAQVQQARHWTRAGASMVLGHHPHVIQGLETHQGRPIAYSLGNFLAANVHYDGGDVLAWNRAERAGCILLADLGPQGVTNVRQVPTFDDGRVIRIDTKSPQFHASAGCAARPEAGQPTRTYGERVIARANRAVARGVTPGRYRRERLWTGVIRPTLEHLRWSRLRHLRPRHFRNAIRSLTKG